MASPHCPFCKGELRAPRERAMPDRVVEHRCPSCNYQIPLLGIGGRPEEPCPECAAGAPSAESVSGVDSTALLNLLYCGSCGCVMGRYWGIIGL